MEYLQLRQMIEHSQPEDWLYNDDLGVWTLKRDVLVNLAADRTDEDRFSKFDEPWVEEFPDHNAYRSSIDLRYSGAFVERYYVVHVDGGKTTLPMPTLNNTIDSFQNALGPILNMSHQMQIGFDFELQRAGIKVV